MTIFVNNSIFNLEENSYNQHRTCLRKQATGLYMDYNVRAMRPKKVLRLTKLKSISFLTKKERPSFITFLTPKMRHLDHQLAIGTMYVPAVCTVLSFIRLIRSKFAPLIEKPVNFIDRNLRYGTTPVSILEIKINMPSRIIFTSESLVSMEDPSEFAQIPAIRLGEGTLGPLFKTVLNSGLIVTVRKLRSTITKSPDLEKWIKFFGRIHDVQLSPILFSFWYGTEVFLLYEYMCLGSLEELLHGKEGIQFTPLNWGIRLYIALCTSKAIVTLHAQASVRGEAMVCGVIKASNILIRNDFSACLSGYETPYLASPKMIIRRNPGRIAPELERAKNVARFTQKSDVYSFGILLLELITGKKPIVSERHGDIWLVDYVKNKREKEDLQGLYDDKMTDIRDNIVTMVEIAEFCLKPDPKQRPTMENVVKMIQELHEDSVSVIR